MKRASRVSSTLPKQDDCAGGRHLREALTRLLSYRTQSYIPGRCTVTPKRQVEDTTCTNVTDSGPNCVA